MTPYQEFIAKSRYARYLPEMERREHWPETVDRWLKFFKEELSEKMHHQHFVWEDIRRAMMDLDVLPSMRSVMTAGEALRRTNVAAYNCAYLPIDSPRSFDEAMYILLCGTGVGYSVESQYVEQLPKIPATLKEKFFYIVVEDSKEGWCDSYRVLIEHLYRGEIPMWDISLVRPAGAPLKTFGGRASGPGPLVDLFQYTIDKFKQATGRRLSSIEAHDIMCKIGEVVVVGGVRRSAMISLGDLGDYEHASAKKGSWWRIAPERALSNNSAVYEEKPHMGQFMTEWLAIYDSHSGERGIFNREASQVQAAKWGKRSPDIAYGTNPCSEIILRPYQFCNLSTVVLRPNDGWDEIKNKVAIATIMGTMQATLTDFPYLRDIWRQNTREEALLGVSMTGILGNKLMLDDHIRPQLLAYMRDWATAVNERWAFILGINQAAAITCVKPEGTVSQLTQTKSGIHPGHNDFYKRTVRQDNKDPLTTFLKESGVPNEPCVMKPNDTTIFSFPVADVGINRNDITAVEHLNIWLDFQRYWCHHKPSVTISVREHEWMEVGDWVYKHFDECTGIAFLPYDGGTYQQAPFQDITHDEYVDMVEQMPHIEWDKFKEYSDTVEGAQLLACTSGVCSI